MSEPNKNCLRTMSVALALAVLSSITAMAQTTNQQNSDRGAYSTSVPAASPNTATPANTAGNENSSSNGASNSTEAMQRQGNSNNWGWIGLLGLAGLAGLRPRKSEDVRRLEATGVDVKTVKTA